MPNTRRSKDKSDQFVAHDTQHHNPKFVKNSQPKNFVGSDDQEQERKVVQFAAQPLLEAVILSPAVSPIRHASHTTTAACLMKENDASFTSCVIYVHLRHSDLARL